MDGVAEARPVVAAISNIQSIHDRCVSNMACITGEVIHSWVGLADGADEFLVVAGDHTASNRHKEVLISALNKRIHPTHSASLEIETHK